MFFAGKACSNLWFLEQVRAAGAGIEVNSGGELWKALRAGFAPDQAVFNGVAKSRRELGMTYRPMKVTIEEMVEQMLEAGAFAKA